MARKKPKPQKAPHRVLVGRLGALERHYPGEDHTALRREVKLETLTAYVTRVVNEAPPLLPSQRAELARIIRNSKPTAGSS